MVKTLLFFVFIACVANAYSSGVQVSSDIESEKCSEGRPITVTITVLHSKDLEVDANRFILDGKVYQGNLIGQHKQSSIAIINGKRKEYNNLISTYQFEIGGRARGNYLLKQIEVSIDGKKYYTRVISYEIYGASSSSSFRLSASVDAPQKIYPGQKLSFIYRIVLNTNIEPTLQKLPLLEPKDFKKIGEKIVRNYDRGGTRVQEIIQEVEAIKPGSYNFEESVLEGLAFREDFFGRRVYSQPKLRAESLPITVEVLDFPLADKPESFNGCVGKFTFQVKLNSDPNVSIGDKVELEIKISGSEGLNHVQLPHMSSQSGFKGSFRFNDLPSIGKITGFQKTFIYELRPMSTTVKEIPSIEFSFFNPQSEQYVVIKSDPIPINVSTGIVVKKKSNGEVIEEIQSIATHVDEPRSYDIQPLELGRNLTLSIEGMKPQKNSYWLLLSIPMCALGLISQGFFRNVLMRKKHQEEKSSKYYFLLFDSEKKERNISHLLERLFILRLYELKIIASGSLRVHRLSIQGKQGEVKSFLLKVEEMLFSNSSESIIQEVLSHAKELYRDLEKDL